MKIKIKEILPIIILLALVGVLVAVILSRSGGEVDLGGGSEAPAMKMHLYEVDLFEDEYGVQGYFDTVCAVYDYSGMSNQRFRSVCERVEELLLKYHRLFDKYHQYEGLVNLATLNGAAGGEAVKVSTELFEFLQYAVSLCELTGGEMNIAMGSVLSIWHDFREKMNDPSISVSSVQVPGIEELSAAAAHTDISVIELDYENMTVRISDPNAKIDVGALGKGYAAEMIGRELAAMGVDDFLMNFGGNVKIIGDKAGQDFRVGIQDPRSYFEEYISVVNVKGQSVVTSGDYERSVIKDGVNYHHIIDRDTLMPAEHFPSVTVVTENSALADALSTALFCMSVDDGRALVGRLRADGVTIRVIYVDYDKNVIEI